MVAIPAQRMWAVMLLTVAILGVAPPAALAGPGPSALGMFLPGDPWSITPGDVDQAGDSGRFVVKDRTISGELSVNDGAAEPFAFTFNTNVPIETQSGQFHGTLLLENSGIVANVHGASSLAFIAFAIHPLHGPVLAIGLALEGRLTFMSGAQGVSDLSGIITAAIDLGDLHIVDLLPTTHDLLAGDFVTKVGEAVTQIVIAPN